MRTDCQVTDNTMGSLVAETCGRESAESPQVRTHAQKRAEIESSRVRASLAAKYDLFPTTVLRPAALSSKSKCSRTAYATARLSGQCLLQPYAPRCIRLLSWPPKKQLHTVLQPCSSKGRATTLNVTPKPSIWSRPIHVVHPIPASNKSTKLINCRVVERTVRPNEI